MSRAKDGSSSVKGRKKSRKSGTGTRGKTARAPGAPRPEDEGTIVDRRVVQDRRQNPNLNADHVTGLEHRRGPGRRRSDFTRTAEEGEMTTEQFLFLMAIDAFKRVNSKTFPSWSDVLEIIRRLGYRKVQESELNLCNAEDWTESADAPVWPQEPGSGYNAGDDLDDFEDAA